MTYFEHQSTAQRIPGAPAVQFPLYRRTPPEDKLRAIEEKNYHSCGT
ncbi:MAG: hypothetical protein J6O50_11620 [Ruminiclostridium sp.]|nr:hypothetical protein [Ruminiclostridium sp.]